MDNTETNQNSLVSHKVVIERSFGWSTLGLKDVWEYRGLLYFTILREIQGRYRQTALGYTWMFIRPVINTLVLTLAFGVVVGVPSDGLPYPLFSLAGLLPWSYFAQAAQRSSYSLVDNRNLISKVYFPRLIAPMAAVMSGLVDFAAAMVVFLGAMVLYQLPLRWEMLTLPIFLLVTISFALGVGLWLATLAARFQDVNFAVVFLIQALMYASPVIYPMSQVPEALYPLYVINPMTGVIQGFRWALLGSGEPPGAWFLIGIGIIMIGLISGAYVFRRTERNIVDVI